MVKKNLDQPSTLILANFGLDIGVNFRQVLVENDKFYNKHSHASYFSLSHILRFDSKELSIGPDYDPDPDKVEHVTKEVKSRISAAHALKNAINRIRHKK